jgi:hypothetical protein
VSFVKKYIAITNAVLSLSLVFNLLGILEVTLIRIGAGIFVVLGVGLLFGHILLILSLVNKKEKIGWMLVRFSYVTLFVMILGMLSLAVGIVIASFFVLGSSSIQAMMMLSMVGLTSWICFGICLTGVCYHTLPIDGVWNIQ